MLENNVNELKHNREGYLSKRKQAWQDVQETRFQQNQDMVELEEDVEIEKANKLKLKVDLETEQVDLEGDKNTMRQN